MTTYSYDRENRLISQNVDGNVTSFAYDGFGRKKRESRGVNPDVILNWDGDQMIVESSDLDPEAPSKAYYIADDVIYAENSNLGSKRSRRDYAVDFLGSVTGLVDGDCSLSSARRWSAFGKLLSGSAEPIGYFWTGNTGSRVYQSLGLNDNRARHYGRNIKQWITRDPIWPTELPYAYVGGNPVTRIDPSGFGVIIGTGEVAVLQSIWKILRKWDGAGRLKDFYDCLDKDCVGLLNPTKSGQDPAQRIKDLIADKYPGTITINSVPDTDTRCKEGNRCAFAAWDNSAGNYIIVGGIKYPTNYTIYLCLPRALDSRACGDKRCILLHELLHAIGFSHDDRENQSLIFECVSKITGCERFGATLAPPPQLKNRSKV